MGIRAGAVALLCLASTAIAQPGPDSQAPSAPPAGYGPPPPGNYYAPTPQQYAVQITEEERDLLARGEIDGSHVALGGLGAIFFGFGVGQAIQGRWSDTGWIFTFGEIGTLAMVIGGVIDSVSSCNDYEGSCNDSRGVTVMAAGLIGFTALRIWESVDAFTGPAGHNRRVRDLRMRLGYGPYPAYYGMTPYITPTGDGGGTAGLSLRF